MTASAVPPGTTKFVVSPADRRRLAGTDSDAMVAANLTSTCILDAVTHARNANASCHDATNVEGCLKDFCGEVPEAVMCSVTYLDDAPSPILANGTAVNVTIGFCLVETCKAQVMSMPQFRDSVDWDCDACVNEYKSASHEASVNNLWWIGVLIMLSTSTVSNLGMVVQKYSVVSEFARPAEVRRIAMRQPLWRFGFFLVITMALGDFASLCFASAALVTPCGAVSLVSNVIFSWWLLGEAFTRYDLIGTLVLLMGIVLIGVYGPKEEKCRTVPSLIHILHRRDVHMFLAVDMGIIGLGIIAVLCIEAARKALGERSRKWRSSLKSKMLLFLYPFLAGVLSGHTILCAKFFGISTRMLIIGDMAFDDIDGWLLVISSVVGIVVTVLVQMFFLGKAMRYYDAMVSIPILSCANLLTSIVTAAVFFRDFDGFPLFDSLMYGLALLCVTGGITVMLFRPHREGDEDHEHGDLGRGNGNGMLGAVPEGEAAAYHDDGGDDESNRFQRRASEFRIAGTFGMDLMMARSSVFDLHSELPLRMRAKTRAGRVVPEHFTSSEETARNRPSKNTNRDEAVKRIGSRRFGNTSATDERRRRFGQQSQPPRRSRTSGGSAVRTRDKKVYSQPGVEARGSMFVEEGNLGLPSGGGGGGDDEGDGRAGPTKTKQRPNFGRKNKRQRGRGGGGGGGGDAGVRASKVGVIITAGAIAKEKNDRRRGNKK